jgi:hypothetical protein
MAGAGAADTRLAIVPDGGRDPVGTVVAAVPVAAVGTAADVRAAVVAGPVAAAGLAAVVTGAAVTVTVIKR